MNATTKRLQRIIYYLDQAAEVKRPFNAAEQNVINNYFDYLLHNIIPPKEQGSITQRIQLLANEFEQVCEIAPLTSAEKSLMIELYAEYFGYNKVADIYNTPIRTSPAHTTIANPLTPADNSTPKNNYKTVATVVGIAIVAIVAFFLFRKKRR